MSPTCIKLPSSTVIDVSPTLVEPSTCWDVVVICSNAVALGQVATNKELPQAPADVAANVPTEPCPVE